jgi:hypothetical protein
MGGGGLLRPNERRVTPMSPKQPPELPPQLQAEADDLLRLQRDLSHRLIPPLVASVRDVLDGENTFAATQALLDVASSIILLVLDRLPARSRAHWIKQFRPQLEATRKSPHSMSDDTYVTGTFEGFVVADAVDVNEALARFGFSYRQPDN